MRIGYLTKMIFAVYICRNVTFKQSLQPDPNTPITLSFSLAVLTNFFIGLASKLGLFNLVSVQRVFNAKRTLALAYDG